MLEQPYDSTEDTNLHRENVNRLMIEVAFEIARRGDLHDASKLGPIEKPYFDEYTPKLKLVTFGSPEYEQYRKELKVALDHHYEVNDHHPEFFKNQIADMNLIQLLEYCCDCYASMSRSNNGNIENSLNVAQQRYNFNEDMKNIFRNTLQYLEHISQ